jgi:hypothetical protein
VCIERAIASLDGEILWVPATPARCRSRPDGGPDVGIVRDLAAAGLARGGRHRSSAHRVEMVSPPAREAANAIYWSPAGRGRSVCRQTGAGRLGQPASTGGWVASVRSGGEGADPATVRFRKSRAFDGCELHEVDFLTLSGRPQHMLVRTWQEPDGSWVAAPIGGGGGPGPPRARPWVNFAAQWNTERFSSCDLAGLKDMDGFGELASPPGAAAEFVQDPPGLQLGVGAFAWGA